MRQPLTIERTALYVLFLLLFSIAARAQVDTDTWWHLRAGEWMLANGQVMGADPFSHTFAGEWRTGHDWLSQIILYGVWQAAGDLGLTLFTAGLATVGMAFLYAASAGSTYLRAFVLVLGAASAAVFWAARPQMFTFALSAALLLLLLRYKTQGQARLWLMPPLFLLWVQLHGGWSVGVLIVASFIVGEALNRLALRYTPLRPDPVLTWAQIARLTGFSALSGAAMLINPYGLEMLLVPLQTVNIGPLTQYIQEWNPPDFTRPETWPFALLLLLSAVFIVKDWRRLDFSQVLLLGGSAFLALTAARNIAFFATAAVPILSLHLAAWTESRGWVVRSAAKPTPRQRRLNQALLLSIGLLALLRVLLAVEPVSLAAAKAEVLPVEAVAVLNAQQPPGTLFNSYNWGGYVMFYARDYPVFIDGRTDLYTDFLEDYRQIANAQPGWEDALARWGVQVALIETGSGLDAALRESADWALIHEDALAALHVQRQ